MTDQQHPINPPPELQEEWLGLWPQDALLQAARWGADMELKECCEWFQEFYKIETWVDRDLKAFKAARRPKPPSLAEEGYDALDTYIYGNPDSGDKERTYNAIRRALERLQELEGQGDG